MRCIIERSTFSWAKAAGSPEAQRTAVSNHFCEYISAQDSKPGRGQQAKIGVRVRITISKENYLNAIAEAESEGRTVIAATLGRGSEVSAPAVTRARQRP